MDRLLNGNKEYKRTYKLIFAVVRSFGVMQNDMEDIVQECMTSLAYYGRLDSSTSYIRRVAINMCKRYFGRIIQDKELVESIYKKKLQILISRSGNSLNKTDIEDLKYYGDFMAFIDCLIENHCDILLTARILGVEQEAIQKRFERMVRFLRRKNGITT